MQGSWLESFRGQHVTVVTRSDTEKTDTGTLVRLDDGWLQLVKDNGEMLLIPATAIRIVKLINMHYTTPAIEHEPQTNPIPPGTRQTPIIS